MLRACCGIGRIFIRPDWQESMALPIKELRRVHDAEKLHCCILLFRLYIYHRIARPFQMHMIQPLSIPHPAPLSIPPPLALALLLNVLQHARQVVDADRHALRLPLDDLLDRLRGRGDVLGVRGADGRDARGQEVLERPRDEVAVGAEPAREGGREVDRLGGFRGGDLRLDAVDGRELVGGGRYGELLPSDATSRRKDVAAIPWSPCARRRTRRPSRRRTSSR
jgi:hypothetical protein